MARLRGTPGLILRVLFGLIFLAAGAAKLAGVPMMVAEFALFERYGLGPWFRYVTGAIEVAGALLLIRAATVFPGAALHCALCLGALVAQAAVIHQDVVHPILFAALLAWLAWAYRPARA